MDFVNFYPRIKDWCPSPGKTIKTHKAGILVPACEGNSHHPSATSSSIMMRKPAMTLTVPVWECSPSCASGISSSTTT